MKAQIYFANLKRAITGTTVGAKHALDVNVLATVAPGSAEVVQETRYHNNATTNIQSSAGNYVEIGTDPAASALGVAITKIKVNCTFGEPISIRKGANAAAADAGTDLCLLNKGEANEFPVSLIAGDKLWVRSKSTNSIATGLLTLNLIG